MSEPMRDQDSVAVLIQWLGDIRGLEVFDCGARQNIDRTIAALQSQQDGAQGGDSVAGWQVFHPEDGWTHTHANNVEHYRGLGFPLRPLFARPAIAPQGAQSDDGAALSLLHSLIGSSRDDERKGLPAMSALTARFRDQVLAALAPQVKP